MARRNLLAYQQKRDAMQYLSTSLLIFGCIFCACLPCALFLLFLGDISASSQRDMATAGLTLLAGVVIGCINACLGLRWRVHAIAIWIVTLLISAVCYWWTIPLFGTLLSIFQKLVAFLAMSDAYPWQETFFVNVLVFLVTWIAFTNMISVCYFRYTSKLRMKREV